MGGSRSLEGPGVAFTGSQAHREGITTSDGATSSRPQQPASMQGGLADGGACDVEPVEYEPQGDAGARAGPPER